MSRKRRNSRHYMAINDDKLMFFKEQLFRELSHMFRWEGLPETIAEDYLERNLIRFGNVLFYEDENIGMDVLRCQVLGYNRHEQPTSAQTFTPNTIGETIQVTRTIKRLSDSKSAIENFNPLTDGVLIQNMEFGQSVNDIVNHYAERLALTQQSLDTNLLWTNIPYIFVTDGKEQSVSINRLFDDIFSGRPAVVTDKELMFRPNGEPGVTMTVPFLVKDLHDVMNEINMQFRQAVGFDTPGVEKAERVNTLEITSNEQHTTSVMDIMLQQRRIAAENINAFFGLNVEVKLTSDSSDYFIEEEEAVDDGDGNYNAEGLTEDGFSAF